MPKIRNWSLVGSRTGDRVTYKNDESGNLLYIRKGEPDYRGRPWTVKPGAGKDDIRPQWLGPYGKKKLAMDAAIKWMRKNPDY